MGRITVDVVLPNGIERAHNVTLSDNVESSSLARIFAEKAKLLQASAEHVECRFANKRDGRMIGPSETLEQAGVEQGDTLRLLLDGIPAGMGEFRE